MNHSKGRDGGHSPADFFGRLLAEAVPFVPYRLKVNGNHEFPVEAEPVVSAWHEDELSLSMFNSGVKSCVEENRERLNIRFINRSRTLWVTFEEHRLNGELPVPRCANLRTPENQSDERAQPCGELICEGGAILPIVGAVVLLTSLSDLERVRQAHMNRIAPPRGGVERPGRCVGWGGERSSEHGGQMDGGQLGTAEADLPVERDLTHRELLAEIAGALHSVRDEKEELRREQERVRKLVDECGYSADVFICGLTDRLSLSEMSLFFKLIQKRAGKCLTYEEIAAGEGCTRQNILARRRKIEKREPAIRGHIDRARKGVKERLFSEMSPRQRRERGIDESYN